MDSQQPPLAPSPARAPFPVLLGILLVALLALFAAALLLGPTVGRGGR